MSDTPVVDSTEAPEATDTSETVSRAEYEKLQKENQSYRERWKPYEQALSKFDDGDRDFIVKQWLPKFHESPDEFVGMTQQIIAQLSPAEKAEVKAEVAEATDDKGKPLTADEIDKILEQKLSEREKHSAQQREVEQVYTQVREAGFNEKSWEGVAIMRLALDEFDGDITKAAEKFKGSFAKAEDPPANTPPPSGQVAAPAGSVPKDLNEAHKAAMQFLRQNA